MLARDGIFPYRNGFESRRARSLLGPRSAFEDVPKAGAVPGPPGSTASTDERYQGPSVAAMGGGNAFPSGRGREPAEGLNSRGLANPEGDGDHPGNRRSEPTPTLGGSSIGARSRNAAGRSRKTVDPLTKTAAEVRDRLRCILPRSVPPSRRSPTGIGRPTVRRAELGAVRDAVPSLVPDQP